MRFVIYTMYMRLIGFTSWVISPSYFTSSDNDSELVESVICPSEIVLPVIHFLLSNTDGNRSHSIIDSKVILVIYSDKPVVVRICRQKCVYILLLNTISNNAVCNDIPLLAIMYQSSNKIFNYDIQGNILSTQSTLITRKANYIKT